MATPKSVNLVDAGSTRLGSVSDLERYREALVAKKDPARKVVSVCTGTGCKAYKCDTLASSLREEVSKAGLDEKVEIVATGCHGFCERGALMVIYPEEVFYQKVKPERASEIVEKTLAKGEVIEELLYTDPSSGERYVKETDIPFYKHQQQELLHMGRLIDPR
ncbi:MAG: (2Fe-2S) ferredoxin domain-containing protein, partial [Polyangia bacterium]|nr:(2Fe-2S) ferredoxin domain-containing protein [Polyangia bacterium]